ncbi:MAG: hypothetical protein ACUVQ0_04610 [Thermoproteota archaeon]
MLEKPNRWSEHTLLEINAIDLFKNKGSQIIAIEKRLAEVGKVIDIVKQAIEETWLTNGSISSTYA